MKKIYIAELLIGVMLMISAGTLYSFTAGNVDQNRQYRIHRGYVVGASKRKQWKFIQRTKTKEGAKEKQEKQSR
ncbi:MAG TPA: hypothetical protein H9754_10045 [Candidatus Anaerostipes avistercoris]|uniref:Uncharacterized protein n=1 Tax=Candidatus Anaerostipes avistercoris TaxID=2838462 RepID=A0A9D2T8Z8_9FIRM|nr:hypothetical protein [Candidatus Anaerostipes avistercoris]